MSHPLRLLSFVFWCLPTAFAAPRDTFTNPLLDRGPDPWVVRDRGFYYYMATTGKDLTVWKTRDITDLRNAVKKVVWVPPATGPYSRDIWAPEMHRIQNRWYIYFAADGGANRGHRLWVIENSSRDPLEGRWVLKGKIADRTDRWAIDGSVFEHRHRLYLLWSGWEGEANGTQNIYIAGLRNPWTVESERVRISAPELPWETIGDFAKPDAAGLTHVNVNEGPEFLQHGKKLFVVYSASGCWTDKYALGMLTASEDADLLRADSWKKDPRPVFTEDPAAHAYGPGHNGFFVSPNGRENWIIYHANPEPHEGCGNHRSPRAQRFEWRRDGLPDFGKPAPTGTPMAKPK